MQTNIGRAWCTVEHGGHPAEQDIEYLCSDRANIAIDHPVMSSLVHEMHSLGQLAVLDESHLLCIKKII